MFPLSAAPEITFLKISWKQIHKLDQSLRKKRQETVNEKLRLFCSFIRVCSKLCSSLSNLSIWETLIKSCCIAKRFAAKQLWKLKVKRWACAKAFPRTEASLRTHKNVPKMPKRNLISCVSAYLQSKGKSSSHELQVIDNFDLWSKNWQRRLAFKFNHNGTTQPAPHTPSSHGLRIFAKWLENVLNH